MHTPKRKSAYLSRRRKKYLIEVHAEAYYRALKKIENESTNFRKLLSPHRSKTNKTRKIPYLNCPPFVRQYDILSNKWGVYYAKRSTKQKVYARIQAAGRGDNAQGKSKL